MAPIPIHALAYPIHQDWCTLFAPFRHQPAPRTGIFDIGYGETPVLTSCDELFTYHSGYNRTYSEAALGIKEGINAGKAREESKHADILALRDEGLEGQAGLAWLYGTALIEEVTQVDGGDTGLVKRGEALQAMAWAAVSAGTKHIVKEGFKAAGRQIYKAFHDGDTAGLEGTMFEKAPQQPYSWELQEDEDKKNRQTTEELIQREDEVTRARKAGGPGGTTAKRAIEEEVAEDAEGDAGKDEEAPKIEDVYFGDSWDEIRSANL